VRGRAVGYATRVRSRPGLTEAEEEQEVGVDLGRVDAEVVVVGTRKRAIVGTFQMGRTADAGAVVRACDADEGHDVTGQRRVEPHRRTRDGDPERMADQVGLLGPRVPLDGFDEPAQVGHLVVVG
jgi:hypothetical protein